MRPVCHICPRHCSPEEGKYGYCRARRNEKDHIICKNYGWLTALALDPVEKKPLRHFYPGRLILSAGSYGCNLRCPFCQNHQISMTGHEAETMYFSPESLVQKAVELKKQGNIGLAYTYNEPLIGYEYVQDCAKLIREQGMKNVVVTNGMICAEPLQELLPYIDAMNIDLKGFTQENYDFVRGDLETVKNSIALASQSCHVEVTALIVPDKNDSEENMRELSKWLASLRKDIPLHVTRFFPLYEMQDQPPTPIHTIYRLAEIARENLQYVYEGNC